jgi:hypothetical protein
MTSAATGPDAPTTVLATHHLEEVPSTVTPRRAAHRGACGRSRTGRGGPFRERVVTLLRAGHRGRVAGWAMVGAGLLILTTAACVAWESSLAPGVKPPR